MNKLMVSFAQLLNKKAFRAIKTFEFPPLGAMLKGRRSVICRKDNEGPRRREYSSLRKGGGISR